MELENGRRFWPQIIQIENQIWKKTQDQTGREIKIVTKGNQINWKYKKSNITINMIYGIPSNSITHKKWIRVADDMYCQPYGKKSRSLTIPDDIRIETTMVDKNQTIKTWKDAQTQTDWSETPRNNVEKMMNSMKKDNSPMKKLPTTNTTKNRMEITKMIKDTEIRRNNPLIAKASRSKLNTYYIETTDIKRTGDIIIGGTRMTPIWSISSRFPEFYKFLSAANGSGGWRTIEAARKIEVLKNPPKPEIWRHVIKNIDNKKPGRRTTATI